MHLAFITRGHIEYVNKFINELAAHYLNFSWYNPQSKKMEPRLMQMRVCPIQLWDISFPKQYWDAVAKTVLGGSMKGKPNFSSHQKYLWLLKKAMHLNDIPTFKEDNWLSMSPPGHMDIIGIGVREDKWLTEDGRSVDEKDKTPLSWEGI